jgi:hypothetical protein
MWCNMLISDPSKNSQFLGDSKNCGVINMGGNTRVTVFEHLRDSTVIWFIQSFSCRELAETHQKNAYAGIKQKIFGRLLWANKIPSNLRKNVISTESNLILTIVPI